MATKIVLPEMGEGVIEGTLSRWLVKPGDQVAQYAPIAEVETDKVTTETTAEMAGTILELCVTEGQTVPVGTVSGLYRRSRRAGARKWRSSRRTGGTERGDRGHRVDTRATCPAPGSARSHPQ